MSDKASSDPSQSAAERLKSIPLFTQLSEVEVTRITEVARERTYPKNSVILFEDDPGDALYVVLTGEVKVVLIGEDGREVILSILRSGDFFGEMSLIDDQPRSAHVIATEDSNLLVLRRDEFRQCLEDAPRIALGLLQALSRRLRRADDKIGGLVLLDVNGRVARVLVELADEHDGEHVPRKITHHMLAQMIGSSRETVSRTIRDLGERGLIKVSRKDITIVDRPGLEELAGL
ncbi:MAG: Crp/Fnr family transcriptional regulator [Gemmatimonadota bacterium]|nr:MAG: Crp/Fnr family transcriptional regulator [Gemmatimonadota bacterium]